MPVPVYRVHTIVAERRIVDVIVDIGAKPFCLGIENAKASIFGAYPDPAIGIFCQAKHDIQGQAACAGRIIPEMPEPVCPGLVTFQASAPGTRPYASAAILEKTADIVIGKGAGVTRVMNVSEKFPRSNVQLAYATPEGGNPELMIHVFHHIRNVVVGEAGRL
jgi:hypothetical protein